MLTPGTLAPDFSRPADDGTMISRDSLRGKPVVIYFYPKDDTPGCTTEACEFRDLFPRFSASGATILGVSPDSVKSHLKFKKKYALPFTLLADEDHSMAEAFGVWKEKTMFGRKYMGVERTTFVLDADGRIAHVFEKVSPAGHAEEVERALEMLKR